MSSASKTPAATERCPAAAPAKRSAASSTSAKRRVSWPDGSAAVQTDVLGFKDAGRDGTLSRCRASEAVGGVIDIREAKGFLPGRLGRGSVHHIAFRAADDASQAAMAQKLVADLGLQPTHQLDRQYFRSVYFREPGGILFEIATDAPGFAVDEPVETLGRDLKLPPFLEARRKEIEAVLPDLQAAERTA